KRLGLGIEKRVLDRAERQCNGAAGGGAGGAIKLLVDALVLADSASGHARGKPFDDGCDPGRPKVFGKLAPAAQAAVGGELEEMVVAPTGVAGKRLDARDLHGGSPCKQWTRAATELAGRAAILSLRAQRRAPFDGLGVKLPTPSAFRVPTPQGCSESR